MIADRRATVIGRSATGKAIDIIFGIGERVKQAFAAPASFAPEGRAYRAWNVTPGAPRAPVFVRKDQREGASIGESQ